jgi:hypothetical protein
MVLAAPAHETVELVFSAGLGIFDMTLRLEMEHPACAIAAREVNLFLTLPHHKQAVHVADAHFCDLHEVVWIRFARALDQVLEPLLPHHQL